MIIPKMLINTIATQLVKHFKLDRIMSYVFEDNELHLKIKKLENRVNLLESLSDHLDLHLRIETLEKGENNMPYGKGTYGTKKGRPPKKGAKK